MALAERGVRSAIVRLPRSVHEARKQCGFASVLVGAARSTGISGYVGDGAQRWPACIASTPHGSLGSCSSAPSRARLAHAVADEGHTMRSIAEFIGRKLGLATTTVPAETFGFLGSVFAVDQPASSARTRAEFGWQPTHPSLLADLEAGDYPA